MYIEIGPKHRRILNFLSYILVFTLTSGILLACQAASGSFLTTRTVLPTVRSVLMDPLTSPTQDSTSTASATTEVTLSPQPSSTPTPTSTASPTPTIAVTTVCEGPPRMMILAVGLDRRQFGYDYGLADVIRVVRADFVSGEVTVLTLPRDLWVKVPGLEGKGITEAKLNTAYYYGSEYYGVYDDPDYGSGFMIDTLFHNYNLQIDRYLTVNLLAFESIIDAVGGVDVYLPYDVDGKSIDPNDPFDLGFFPAGMHHFNGETAGRFARIRMMDNDYLRTTRQTMVLKALWKKLITPSILPKTPELIAILSDSVQMNFEARDIRPFICLLPMLDNETLKFVSLPQEMLQETYMFVDRYQKNLFIIKADETELKRLMGDFQRGVWPTPEPLPSPTP